MLTNSQFFSNILGTIVELGFELQVEEWKKNDAKRTHISN